MKYEWQLAGRDGPLPAGALHGKNGTCEEVATGDLADSAAIPIALPQPIIAGEIRDPESVNHTVNVDSPGVPHAALALPLGLSVLDERAEASRNAPTTANPVAAAVAPTTPVADQELPNWQMESNAETWSEVRDPNTGRNYYVNRHTNETSWTKPAAIAKPPPRKMPPPALPQFSEHIDPASGRSYYVNNTTQETVWQLPRGATVHSTRTQNPAASFSAL